MENFLLESAVCVFT
uniref:Uncharacterized protein n=1 Tax=Anguilla anguilla TaxID=7936 RepID=A0A0E9QEY9_ANGAN